LPFGRNMRSIFARCTAIAREPAQLRHVAIVDVLLALCVAPRVCQPSKSSRELTLTRTRASK
jgi:hypothetical protein